MGILVVNTATLIPLVMKHAMATESLPFKQVMQFRNVGFSVAMFNVLQGVSIVVFGALPQFFPLLGNKSDGDQTPMQAEETGDFSVLRPQETHS